MAHIGIDARLIHYRPMGGTSTYIRQLLRALERIDTANTYTVLVSRKSRETLVPRLCHAALWTPPHHRWERVALSVELARLRLDVLHSTDFIPPLRGARHHVITIHDLAFLRYPEIMTPDSRRYYNQQIRRAAQQADHILTVSRAAKQDIVAMLNVPAEKITVQYHGVDDAFKPLDVDTLTAARERLRLPQRFVLFVGTFEPRKNIDGLLEAYSMLRVRLPDAPPLVMVGQRGWLIDTTYKRMHNTTGVIVREDIAYADLPAVLNLAEALCLPSHYEGFGLPALEAMACGTLPIVSDVSSLPEVVDDVGLLIDPARPESIATALYRALTADSAWRDYQRHEALARAAEFNWERSARAALSVYQEVI